MNSAILLLAGIIIIAITFLFIGLAVTIILILRRNKKQSHLQGSEESLIAITDEPPTTM